MTALAHLEAMFSDDPAEPSSPPTAPEGPHKRDLIAGLEKGLAVIEAFDQDRPRLTISEVATRCGLTRAAARRYLITLEYLGYVSSDRRMYSLSPKVLRLGQSYMHSARPAAHRAARVAQAGLRAERSLVGRCARWQRRDLHRRDRSRRLVSPTLQPGTRVPAYCTANGRVLLSAKLPAEVDTWLAGQTLEPLTPHTLTDADELRTEINQIRLRGYATVDQEFELGLRTISVPLKNYRGEVLAALNISAHATRVSIDQLVDECLPALLQAQSRMRGTL